MNRKTEDPAIMTRQRIARELAVLGVGTGDVICVHVSMASLGLVIGGPRAVIEGLIDSVGGAGTLMMPAYSGDLSDPAEWRHPAIPPQMIEDIREAIPAYDRNTTPTRGMGTVAEYFRCYPGVRRSPHPQSSFTALGPQAETLTLEHPFDNRFGPTSPLGRLREQHGKVILLGAPYDSVSLFHMTQHLVGGAQVVEKSAPVVQHGVRSWVKYRDIDYPIDWFEDGVRHLIATGIATRGLIGNANCVIFNAGLAVEELVKWRRAHGHTPDLASSAQQ